MEANNNVVVSQKEFEEMQRKAEMWDKLDKKLEKYYFDSDGNELPDDEGGDLADIGEAAAQAFGYL